MMREAIFPLAVSVLILAFANGCATTKSLTGKVTGGSLESLYTEVPTNERNEVTEAEKILTLTELKLDRAETAAKLARTEKALAKNQHEEAEANLQLAKWEAISKVGLGTKDENELAIAKTKKKVANIQGDSYILEAKISQLKRKIAEMDEQIGEQESALENLKE